MVSLPFAWVGWRVSVLKRRLWKIESSDMRDAYGLSPEWARPASSFPRTMGIVLIALAVGATAGATLVFSFVDQPAGQTSVTARSLAPQIQAASTFSDETPKAQRDQRVAVQNGSANEAGTDGPVEGGVAGTPSIGLATPASAGTAALAEAGPATDDVAARAEVAPSPGAEKPPVVAPADKKATKKNHVATRYAWRTGPFGVLPGEYHMNGIWGRY